jgi:anti-sigma regulatory factor (Ser/Thr protein kinase)
MSEIIRFHVPCKQEYAKLVEEVTAQIGLYLKAKIDPEFSGKLRTVMNEVFVNIVKHTTTAEQNEVVRFQFEIGLEFFTISIYDYSAGFPAEGHYPPYPKEVVGKRYKLREVLDGTVYFTVVNPLELSFTFEERDSVDLSDMDTFDLLDDHGLGISIVTKLMDTVTYSYIGQGKFDWKLVKRLT